MIHLVQSIIITLISSIDLMLYNIVIQPAPLNITVSIYIIVSVIQ